MGQILIIADDLSGAADCASAFYKAGLTARVRLDVNGGADESDFAVQVLAVDADSRRQSPAEAATRQLKVFASQGSKSRWLYKKIDSTLRGQVEPELAALIPHAGLAIIAPAFPETGRTTVHGRQYLDGVPLEQTSVWRTEGLTKTSYIPELLQACGIAAAAVGLDDIRRGAEPLREQLEQLAASGRQAVVCDAQTDADLAIIAQASIPMVVPRFWVGSAGLAQHLALHWDGEKSQNCESAAVLPGSTAPEGRTGPILVAVGSLSERSREQAAQLIAGSQIKTLEVPASVLRLGPDSAAWLALSRSLDSWLSSSHDVLVSLASDGPVDVVEGLQLCTALASLIAPSGHYLGGLVATGGETARAILCALGATELTLCGEIEAGIPLSASCGALPLHVVTKAGAFGASMALLKSFQALQSIRSGSTTFNASPALLAHRPASTTPATS